MQTDPIGIAGGVNLYAYVGGDPWGLREWPPGDRAPDVMIYGCRPGNAACRCLRLGIGCIFDPFEIGRFMERLGFSTGNWIGIAGSSPDQQLCDLVPTSDPVVRAIQRAAAATRYSGYFGVVDQAGATVANVGGTANIGWAFEVRDGEIVDAFTFSTVSRSEGFNISASSNLFWSSVSPLGEASSLNAGYALLSGSIVDTGESTGWAVAMGPGIGIGPTMTIENTQAYRLSSRQCSY